MTINKIPADMHAPYWDVYFQSEEKLDDAPESFAIMTGYATTGEIWTEAENKAADASLEKDLREKSKWVKRLTGYSPKTGHAEPGWAGDLDFESACDLGKHYRQDGIYYVIKNVLFVSHCDARRKLFEVGDFPSRTSLVGSSPRSSTTTLPTKT